LIVNFETNTKYILYIYIYMYIYKYSVLKAFIFILVHYMVDRKNSTTYFILFIVQTHLLSENMIRTMLLQELCKYKNRNEAKYLLKILHACVSHLWCCNTNIFFSQ